MTVKDKYSVNQVITYGTQRTATEFVWRMDTGKTWMVAIVPYFKVLLQNLSGRCTVEFVMWRYLLKFLDPDYHRMNAERPGCCQTFFSFQYMSLLPDYSALQLELLLPSNCSSHRANSLCSIACIGVWRERFEEESQRSEPVEANHITNWHKLYGSHICIDIRL
jgi:hypothetical protein